MRNSIVRTGIYSALLLLLLVLSTILIPGTHGQQTGAEDDPMEGFAEVLLSFLCLILIAAGFFFWLTMGIIFAAWVSKDSRGRGMERSGTWTALAFFFGIIGLWLYFAYRIPGKKERCPGCRNKKLPWVYPCPFCRSSKQKDGFDTDSERRCPNCGSPVEEKDSVCPSCFGNL